MQRMTLPSRICSLLFLFAPVFFATSAKAAPLLVERPLYSILFDNGKVWSMDNISGRYVDRPNEFHLMDGDSKHAPDIFFRGIAGAPSLLAGPETEYAPKYKVSERTVVTIGSYTFNKVKMTHPDPIIHYNVVYYYTIKDGVLFYTWGTFPIWLETEATESIEQALKTFKFASTTSIHSSNGLKADFSETARVDILGRRSDVGGQGQNTLVVLPPAMERSR